MSLHQLESVVWSTYELHSKQTISLLPSTLLPKSTQEESSRSSINPHLVPKSYPQQSTPQPPIQSQSHGDFRAVSTSDQRDYQSNLTYATRTLQLTKEVGWLCFRRIGLMFQGGIYCWVHCFRFWLGRLRERRRRRFHRELGWRERRIRVDCLMVCFRRWGFEVRCIKCSCLFRIWLVTSFTSHFLLLPRRDRLLSTRVSYANW